MTKIKAAGLGILLAASISTPCPAHDMSAMDSASDAPMGMGAHLHMTNT